MNDSLAVSAKMALVVLIACTSLLANAAPQLNLTKSVDNANPTAGIPVEFTIVVKNTGDEEVTDIVVLDELPTGLDLASGMGVYFSQGSFDESTGEWALGTLAVDDEATLMLPTSVSLETDLPCYVNKAVVIESTPDHMDASDVSGVYLNGNTSCVDLELTSEAYVPTETCYDAQVVWYSVIVENKGAEAVTDVRLEHVSSTPFESQFIRWGGTGDCNEVSDSVCVFDSIDAGETVSVAYNIDYKLANATTVRLDASVSANQPEYDVSNNASSIEVAIPEEVGIECNPFSGMGPIAVAPGCFIATAAYGTDMEPEVQTLRDFRDEYLMTNPVGRRFVEYYYRLSPPIASVIAANEALRWITRQLLWPLVISVSHPRQLVALLILATMLVGGFWLNRRKGT